MKGLLSPGHFGVVAHWKLCITKAPELRKSNENATMVPGAQNFKKTIVRIRGRSPALLPNYTWLIKVGL